NLPNPVSDFWDLLIGSTEEHNKLGSLKYVLVALFVALPLASIAIAIKNWREEPAQRTPCNIATWLVRVAVGGMWFQGMLWKLPLPVSGALQYWTEHLGSRAAFAFHRRLVREFYLP